MAEGTRMWCRNFFLVKTVHQRLLHSAKLHHRRFASTRHVPINRAAAAAARRRWQLAVSVAAGSDGGSFAAAAAAAVAEWRHRSGGGSLAVAAAAASVAADSVGGSLTAGWIARREISIVGSR